MVLLNKDYYFDEELEELVYEKMEKTLGESVISPMREEDDKGWNEPVTIGRLHVGMMN